MKLRSMVCAPPGELLISCDLSQAESWIVAFEADEPTIKAALVSKEGFHVITARAIFENELLNKQDNPIEIYTGKKTNHATSYMMKPPTFAAQYNKESNNVISVGQARRYQDRWHLKYPRVKYWWDEIREELRKHNGYLSNSYNRRRQFLGPQDDTMLRDAVSFKPQSTIGDHFRGKQQRHSEIPGGLLEFRRRIEPFKDECKIIQQGHDSALLRTKKEIAMDMAHLFRECLHRPIMVRGEVCLIPVDGEIGERWGEMEKIKWN